MTLHGWAFGAELSELKTVGVVDLPALSSTYASLNNVVDGATGSAANAFNWPQGPGRAHPAWTELHNMLQNILGKTSLNIDAAAAAVVHIVDTYAATDDEAAATLKKQWQSGAPRLESFETPPTSPPPPVVLK